MSPNERQLASKLTLALVDNETVRCPGEKCNGTLHAGSNAFQMRCPYCEFTFTIYVRTKDETVFERQRSGKDNPRRQTTNDDVRRRVSDSRAATASDQARQEEVVRGLLFQVPPRSSSGGPGRNLDGRKAQSRSRVSKRQREA